jgi:hypothetical protein
MVMRSRCETHWHSRWTKCFLVTDVALCSSDCLVFSEESSGTFVVSSTLRTCWCVVIRRTSVQSSDGTPPSGIPPTSPFSRIQEAAAPASLDFLHLGAGVFGLETYHHHNAVFGHDHNDQSGTQDLSVPCESN